MNDKATPISWPDHHGSAFANRRVLVTGGAGFIGSHLVDALIALGADAIVIDDLSGGDRANLPDHVPLIAASILDESALRRAIDGCDAVCHLAALGSVPQSVEQPDRYFEVNVLGSQRVLEAARGVSANRLVFASSAAVYGDDPALPKRESQSLKPMSPYAANKAAVEQLLAAHAACYPIDTASLRFFNVFGPRQNANSAYAAVISAFAQAILVKQNSPTIFGDGTQSRDFVQVANIVHAILLALRSEARLGGAAINIACGGRVTVNELARSMARAVGREDLQPVYAPPRAGDVPHSQADITRARQMLGYEPIVDFQSGLTATMAWYAQAALQS